MILWTIKRPEFWTLLQKHGTLHACPAISFAHGCLDGWEDSYQWMIDQMRKRLPWSPSSYRVPIWAWYQRYDEKKKKPDLRGWDYRGYPGVRIEFEIDESQVLLSDFSAWHCVLNRCYMGESEEDDEAFYQEIEKWGYKAFGQILQDEPPKQWWGPICDNGLKQEFKNRVYKSWERIFDLDWYAEKWTDPRKDKSIQATLWEIRSDMVRDVTYFGKRFRK
jgi:hypothetical protein